MKIRIQSAALTSALARASKVDDRSASWGGTALITAHADGALIRACGYTASASVAVPCETEAPGTLGVQIRALSTLASRADEIEIAQTDEKFVTIRAGRSRARSAIIDPAAYPGERPLPEIAHDLDGAHDAIRLLSPLLPRDESRPNLCGIRALLGDSVTYAATDGHRLGVIGDPAALGADGVTIPTGLLGAISACEGAAQIGHDATVVCVRVGGSVLVHSATSDTWPSVGSLIPDREGGVTVDAGELRTAIKGALAVAPGKTDAIRFATDGGSLCLHAVDTHTSTEYEERVPCTGSIDGAVKMNGRYVIDAIAIAEDGGDVTFSTADDATQPVLFAREGALCIVMPMRT